MDKHAYLILAHNEYESLQKLIEALDSFENDIYVHLDRKSKIQPSLYCKFSKLIVLDKRKKVFWGHMSQVFTETYLLKFAYGMGIDYKYYHIISGTHYPLKGREEIRFFFENAEGKSVVQPMTDSEEVMKKRIGHYHFFMKSYFNNNYFYRNTGRFFWKALIKIQYLIGLKRDVSFYGGKVSNWCSLTKEAVRCWIKDEKKIKKRFRWTLCGDEYVVMSVIKENCLPVMYSENLLYVVFEESIAAPRPLTMVDYLDISYSNALFGRKFTKESFDLIKQIKDGKHKNFCYKS